MTMEQTNGPKSHPWTLPDVHIHQSQFTKLKKFTYLEDSTFCLWIQYKNTVWSQINGKSCQTCPQPASCILPLSPNPLSDDDCVSFPFFYFTFLLIHEFTGRLRPNKHRKVTQFQFVLFLQSPLPHLTQSFYGHRFSSVLIQRASSSCKILFSCSDTRIRADWFIWPFSGLIFHIQAVFIEKFNFYLIWNTLRVYSKFWQWDFIKSVGDVNFWHMFWVRFSALWFVVMS